MCVYVCACACATVGLVRNKPLAGSRRIIATDLGHDSGHASAAMDSSLVAEQEICCGTRIILPGTRAGSNLRGESATKRTAARARLVP